MHSILSEIFTLALMAFAVGMDAFSVGLGMGMVPMRLKQVMKIGFVVGSFHIWMPLLGILAGKMLSEQLGTIATYSGGVLLILIGLHMVAVSFKEADEPSFKPVGFGLILFATSVSLDSFPLGLTLGIYGAKTMTVVLMFGFFATVLTWAGLLLGRKIKGVIGTYSEAFGGFILLLFGLRLIFPF